MSLVLDGSPFDHFVNVSKDVAAVAATGTFCVAACSNTAGQYLRIDRAFVLTDTTYAADASDFYAIALKHGSTTIATWSTQTSAQGALTAVTVNEMVMAANTGTNRVVAPNEVLTLVCTKNGSAANLTARVVVHGRFVS